MVMIIVCVYDYGLCERSSRSGGHLRKYHGNGTHSAKYRKSVRLTSLAFVKSCPFVLV